VVGAGLGGVTARTTVTGHNRMVGQAANQASVVGQAGTSTTADSSAPRQPKGASCVAGHAAVPVRILTAILPDHRSNTHSCVGRGVVRAVRLQTMRTHHRRLAPAPQSAFAGFRLPPDVIVLAIR
jgi:hypothetical protein